PTGSTTASLVPEPGATGGPDPLRGRRALRSPDLLDEFGRAGLLDAADVHVAVTLLRIGGTPDDELVGLAMAFAVRAARLGSVQVDLHTIAATAAPEDGTDLDLTALPWPDPDHWTRAVAASA